MAKLLVLDDDTDALAWMAPALEARGHEVRAFTRASDALAVMKEWVPDLILADIIMPEMSGLEFARLARRHRGVPLMFVSVASQRAEAVIAGATGYVQKPATAAEVRSEVERVLGRRGGRSTVLVVDDDPAARFLYHSFLDARFDVIEAENGVRALEVLATRRVDLAIVDVHMPVMGGAELIRRIRSTASLERLPVIVQTADRSVLSAPVWRDLRVSRVIEKNDLLDWIASRIDTHLQQQKAPAVAAWERLREKGAERHPRPDEALATGFATGPLARVVSGALAEEMPFERRLEALARTCREATHAERAVVVLEEDGSFIRATAGADSRVSLERGTLSELGSVPVSVIEQVSLTREPLVLRDASQECPYASDPDVMGHGVRSILAAPIERAQVTVGILYLENSGEESAFSPELAETFRMLSPLIAMALDNSRLHRDLTDATEQKETIRKLVAEREQFLRRTLFLADASRLLASLELEQALDGVAHLAVPYLGDACALDVFDDGETRRFIAISPKSTSALSLEVHPTVLREQSLIYDVGSLSHVGAPVLMKGHLIGAITLSASYDRVYARADRELAEELARRAALSIENARLYRQARDAVRESDEFLSIAAHEIRGPINSIHLAVQSIRQGKVPTDALPRLFELVERQDRRLSQFVDDLLDLGRIRAGVLQLEYQEVDLGQVVAEVAARLGPDLTRSGSPLSVSAERRIVGRWDKSRLDQVIHNLLANAVKFGLGKPIEVAIGVEGGRARVVVTDHGIGIHREALQRIFRPFERGDASRQYGGLGLGLHIVKMILDALGGSVSVESEPGHGATFRVELPLVQGDERHAHPDGR